jgi:hypothetical protein
MLLHLLRGRKSHVKESLSRQIMGGGRTDLALLRLREAILYVGTTRYLRFAPTLSHPKPRVNTVFRNGVVSRNKHSQRIPWGIRLRLQLLIPAERPQCAMFTAEARV